MSKLEVKVLTKALRKEGFLDLSRGFSRTSSSPGIFGSTAVVWGLFGNKQQWVGMVPGSRKPRANLGWVGRRGMERRRQQRWGWGRGWSSSGSFSWLSELEGTVSRCLLKGELCGLFLPPRAGFSRDTETGEIRVAEQGACRHGIREQRQGRAGSWGFYWPLQRPPGGEATTLATKPCPFSTNSWHSRGPGMTKH